MNRRQVIAGFGSAVALPLAVHAQQQAMPVVGLIGIDVPPNVLALTDEAIE